MSDLRGRFELRRASEGLVTYHRLHSIFQWLDEHDLLPAEKHRDRHNRDEHSKEVGCFLCVIDLHRFKILGIGRHGESKVRLLQSMSSRQIGKIRKPSSMDDGCIEIFSKFAARRLMSESHWVTTVA